MVFYEVWIRYIKDRVIKLVCKSFFETKEYDLLPSS